MPTTIISAAAVNDSRSFARGEELECRADDEASERDDRDHGPEEEEAGDPRGAAGLPR